MAKNFHWFGEERKRDLDRHNKRNMEKAVRIVRNDVVRSLSIKVGRVGGKVVERSKPGEAPRLEYGVLRNSIATEVIQESNQTIGRVGTKTEYAKYLELPEYLNRPFLLPAVARTRPEVKRILSTPMK